MDALTRKRRSGLLTEREDSSLHDGDYIAALSQPEASEVPAAGTQGEPAGGNRVGESSPGTLEAGEAQGPTGPPYLQANPFHSDKIKAEVELARNRPETLDNEAARLGLDSREEVLEPDYSAAFGIPVDSGTRVARVEAGQGSRIDHSAASGIPADSGARVARVEAGQGSMPATVEQHVVPGLEASVSGMGQRGQDEELKVLHGGVPPGGLSQGPLPEDTRELVPDKGLSSQVEMLLTQVMEENRALRRRLEQVELHSHSSWHSGVQGEGGLTMSPVSFAVEGSQRFREPVQSWSSLGRFVGCPSEGPVGTASINVPGPAAAVDVGYTSSLNVSGEQLFPVGPRPPEPLGRGLGSSSAGISGLSVGSRALGFQGSEGLEMVPLEESRSLRVTPGARPITPPPPLPIAAPVVRRDSVAAGPQSMRQFAISAGIEASGLGQGQGFYAPRSGCMGQPGFDASGYPVSPGGTIIRPTPGPPPPCRNVIPGGEQGHYEWVPPTMTLGQDALVEGPSVVCGGVGGSRGPLLSGSSEVVRPEEPAKYINELPKLNQVELSQSAVVCGNWLAQVRQVLVGLSPSANVWWQGVENPATLAYRRWLVADPLGRLSIDPSSVVGEFGRRLYSRVESRAVSLLFVAVGRGSPGGEG